MAPAHCGLVARGGGWTADPWLAEQGKEPGGPSPQRARPGVSGCENAWRCPHVCSEAVAQTASAWGLDTSGLETFLLTVPVQVYPVATAGPGQALATRAGRCRGGGAACVGTDLQVRKATHRSTDPRVLIERREARPLAFQGPGTALPALPSVPATDAQVLEQQ